jgi:hypothetical protein
MQYVINLRNVDLVELRNQRIWLAQQKSNDAVEGLQSFLDHIADELDAKYDVQDQFMTSHARTEATKGMEAKVPERFYKGRYPHAETVGDMLIVLSELPAAFPIDTDFRCGAEISVANIGQADLVSVVQIEASQTTNDAIIEWNLAKEQGDDRYVRQGCHYCDGECHTNWLLFGDKAENLCDGYQSDHDDAYEREDRETDDEEEE